MPAPYAGDGPGMAGGMVQVTHKAGWMPRLLIGVKLWNEALSVRQPFASQIVIGEKTIEWRSKPFTGAASGHLCLEKRDHRTGQRETSARSVALGIVDVVGCRPMKREDLVAACCEDYEDEM